MPEFIMIFGDTEVDMTEDVKNAKDENGVAAAVKTAFMKAHKKDKEKEEEKEK